MWQYVHNPLMGFQQFYERSMMREGVPSVLTLIWVEVRIEFVNLLSEDVEGELSTHSE